MTHDAEWSIVVDLIVERDEVLFVFYAHTYLVIKSSGRSIKVFPVVKYNSRLIPNMVVLMRVQVDIFTIIERGKGGLENRHEDLRIVNGTRNIATLKRPGRTVDLSNFSNDISRSIVSVNKEKFSST